MKDRKRARRRIRYRIRKDISGTPERPRVSVFRSINNLYMQVVDDTSGTTLLSASSMDPELSAGLTAFSIAGLDPELIVSHVQEKHNIVIRPIGDEDKGTYGVRASTPYYIRHSEVDLLLEAIDGLAARNRDRTTERRTKRGKKSD